MRIAPKLKLDDRKSIEKVYDQDRGKDIVSHWTADDWLQATNCPTPDWQTAACIIHDRLYGRFLRVIPKIKEMEGAGFAILALDSLLIETLFQFQHGWLKTPVGRASEVFDGFLVNQIDEFDSKKARCFREHFRNGILHSAETLNDSTIVWKKKDQYIVREKGNGIEINRASFQPALLNAFDSYIHALAGNIVINSEVLEKLRAHAVIKMNHICGRRDNPPDPLEKSLTENWSQELGSALKNVATSSDVRRHHCQEKASH